MKISVLGAGGWGTALSIVLNRNRHNVTLWEFNPEYAHTLKEYRENFYYLRGIRISEKIKISNDIEEAAENAELIVISTPVQFIRKVIEPLAEKDLRSKIILSVSKGIENKTLLTVSGIISDVLHKITTRNIAVLSGPSHAEEVAKNIPTAVSAAAYDIKVAKTIQSVFSNRHFRVYRSSDVLGVELGGALKNVIAIAAGIADGAGFGDNTKAAIMTRGIREITRLGVKMGAEEKTFMGLSGIGDLIVTCMSRLSRNRYVGEEIGKGRKLKQILSEMKMVAEGVATAKSVHQLSKDLKVEVPIIEQVYKMLFENKNPHAATEELMTRDLKEEHR
ncbi:MAG: NAD(P)H-dependent glycerol-3-phosphate dehydrogenase [Ignavibacteria bacterium]|nr:NAD(P)H-dependent glycerol-3-phosphate dehydrogenase [Ignavibacteria bacterium]